MSRIPLTVAPLTPAIGAEIIGVDVSQPLEQQTIDAIKSALLEYLVVFFRGQSLSPTDLLRFAGYFGSLGTYPFVKGMDEFPQIVEVVKKENETRNFGGIWHTDTAYLREPPMASILYAKELPPLGGDTLFANMYLAYESLSQPMRDALEGLYAVNSADKADAAATRVDRRREKPKETDDAPTVSVHPVVRTHPETGRKALYVNRGHTIAIEGFTPAESSMLLELLFNHQVSEQLCCRFAWSEGSVAFWDNRAAQHNAINDYQGYRRHMLRVILEGDRPR